MTDRWFIDPAANGPTAISPAFTEFESGIFSQILAFAHAPANVDIELLLCLDAAGAQAFDSANGRKAAPITPAMNEAIAAGTVRQWHNHPSQDSLSHHNWLCACASPYLEVLALNSRGSIFVGRIPVADERLQALLRWLPSLADKVEMHMDRLAKGCGLHAAAIVELSKFTSHLLNLALARRTGVRYAYTLLDGDDATIGACEAHGVVTAGNSFAENANQDWLDTHP